ncbi:MAG TPA: hypothetical protein VGC57_13425 [Cellulomonas sp.]
MSGLTLRRSAATTTAAGALAGLSAYATVDLLPPSVRQRRALQALRGRLGVGLVLVVLVIALGYVAAIMSSANASAQADAAEDERVEIQAQAATYSDAAQVRSEIASVQSAVATVMGTEVLWADRMRSLEGALSGAPLSAFGGSLVDGTDTVDTPFTVAGAVAASDITMTTTTLPDLAALLDALAAVPGVASVTFTSSSADEEGVYTTTGTVVFGLDALSGRYGDSAETEEVGS